MTGSADQRMRKRTSAPAPLIVGAGIFVLLITYLLVSSLLPTSMTTFDPSPTFTAARSAGLVTDTVTIDASVPDRWQFFSFARGSLMHPPDSVGWDLALRRSTVVVSGGALDLGPRTFDDVIAAPASGYVTTSFGRDTVNNALDHWYRYSLISHRLSPNGHIYVVQTLDGHFTKIEFLSYYCTGMVSGCITFRYTYDGLGSGRFR